ncbi:Protein of unknown function [Bacillus wiedmannii]|uniref:Uncharacterized protein n=2 Tax=Bacillus cereus group TaxID=86661 RepID=A0A1C4F4I9_BACTU|nr:Protein of unknown function [Bacillus wiedmannii]SCC50774.1 Protein of unknown function [Bacillus thuringiensis]SCM02757.1 Protein of unknown function [Bacillus wiedmannii]SCN34023.1 Protein of unknown function [Bacillus cereus]
MANSDTIVTHVMLYISR